MSATQIFILALVGVAVVGTAAIFAVAYRRGSEERGPVVGRLDRRSRKRDRSGERHGVTAPARAAAAAPADGVAAEETVAVAEDWNAGIPPHEQVPDPLLDDRAEVTEDEFNVTRRQFFNRSLLGLFGIFLGQFALGGLAFFWPKISGGFGTPIDAGSVDDLRSQILQEDGTMVPVFVASAQSWIVAFDGDAAGSSFEGLPVIADLGAEPGLMALWQKCVHLGCRVPSCESSQGFECPCHGSKYNFHGEYDSGPAPRNMDRFVVNVDDSGHLIVETGQVIPTARAQVKTIAYPQGPNCV
jgi:cytochrome b6-f complex iron-sulfur subunit